MLDASAAFGIRDNASGPLNNISRSVESLESDVESLTNELNNLKNKRVSIRMNLDDARQELRDARKAFNGTEESIQRLQNAHLNVDNISEQLRNVSEAARNTQRDLSATNDELSRSRAGGGIGGIESNTPLNLDIARRELRDARNAFDGTEESIQRLQNASLNFDNITEQIRNVSEAARNAETDLSNADDELSRSRAGGGIASGVDIDDGVNGSTNSLISRLGEAGVWSYAGDILSNTSQTLVSSAYGSNAGTMFGSVISGATSGAALGTMVGGPGIGTAVGAGLGAVGGVITGATQIFEEKDDAFKGYVQDRTQTLLEQEQQSIQNGSSIAAQREKDLISFNTLFKNEQYAKNYLNDLWTVASETPFQYDELTDISKTFASYGLGVGHMIPTIQKIGDAGAALGMETYDMNEIATSLGRMYQGGTVTRELLDIIDDRGINATQMLADAYGVSYGAMLEMISDSEIESQKAFEIILNGMDAAYNGAAKLQGLTFDGLTSTLQDLQTQADAAYGQGFNDTRKVGLQDQIDFEKENMEALEKVNYAIGVYYAELENKKEDLIREYQSDIISSEDFQNADTTEEYVTIAEKLMEAESAALDEYNATIGKEIVDKQISLANSVAENASLNEASWNAGYRIGQQYSKGLAAAVKSSWETALANMSPPGTTTETTTTSKPPLPPNSNSAMSGAGAAFGINRVPYDDYPVRLHQGERVLTANQARQMDSGLGAANININISGMTVREDADINRIAAALAQNLKVAKAVQK